MGRAVAGEGLYSRLCCGALHSRPSGAGSAPLADLAVADCQRAAMQQPSPQLWGRWRPLAAKVWPGVFHAMSWTHGFACLEFSLSKVSLLIISHPHSFSLLLFFFSFFPVLHCPPSKSHTSEFASIGMGSSWVCTNTWKHEPKPTCECPRVHSG